MSWLLFMDESGHDHKSMPYEVRGGVALRAGEVWPFVQDFQRLELACFGGELAQFKTEIKGAKLLDKDRYKWAAQSTAMPDEARRKHCRGFLTKGLQKVTPNRDEFTAYGQASLEMARGIFQLLRDHKAQLFAACIPKGVTRPPDAIADEFLRKDQVFLLERFFYLLELEKRHGLLVMDEVEKTNDHRFVRRLQSYFTRTQTGRYPTQWIVPTPFFVASDMTCPVQAADLCIYCVNWGFRLPARGMNAPTRPEIETEFAPWLKQLQFEGEAVTSDGIRPCFGIVHVPHPYTTRPAQ